MDGAAFSAPTARFEGGADGVDGSVDRSGGAAVAPRAVAAGITESRVSPR